MDRELLVQKIFSGIVPKNTGFIYLFGDKERDESLVFNKALEMSKNGFLVGISRHPGGNGYTGYRDWSNKLRQIGVAPLFPVPQGEPWEKDADVPADMITEVRSLANFAEGTGTIRFGIMTSSPSRQLEALLLVIKKIKEIEVGSNPPENQKMKVYSVAPRWSTELINAEIAGLEENDLVIISEYLEWRDQNAEAPAVRS